MLGKYHRLLLEGEDRNAIFKKNTPPVLFIIRRPEVIHKLAKMVCRREAPKVDDGVTNRGISFF